MRRNCDTCGKAYEAQRVTSKYCSKKCNVRATRTRGKLVLVPDEVRAAPAETAMPPASAPSATAGVLAATRAELEELKALETPMGQLALQLAARIQYVPDTGSGTAAVSRELRQVLDAARAVSKGGSDRVDEINKRRQAKQEAAGS